jgi:hypothetical protein
MLNPLHAKSTNPSPQLQSCLFILPRELRDRIYHHIFLTTRYIYQPFPSPSSKPNFCEYGSTHDILHLRYRLPTAIANSNPDNRPCEPYPMPKPDWLLTCKSLFSEGIAQFVRNAEWYSSSGLTVARRDVNWTFNLSLDTSKINRVEFYVQNLAHYEEPGWWQGTDTRATMTRYADAMRKVDRTWSVLRFVGHSYRFRSSNLYCDDQAANMMRNVVRIFKGLKVQKWEFGIKSPGCNPYWVLFGWVVDEGKEQEQGRLEVICQERRRGRVSPVKPEDDLEKLLPKGWVKKRLPCECEDCELERSEGWPGGWMSRPDSFGWRGDSNMLVKLCWW